MRNIIFLPVIALFLLFTGCNDDDKDFNSPQQCDIKGKVEKGPFIKGSTVTIQELNSTLTPTGKTFDVNILDDEGNFELNDITLESRYVLLSGNGFYFDETRGYLSDAPIKLNAIADLKNGSSININILSHLKKDRLLHLITVKDLSYEDANYQAQNELLTNFGLQRFANKEVNNYSITSGTDEAAALIVVSSSLLSYCDNSPAKLTETLAGLSEELKLNGKFSDINRDKIRKCSQKLYLDNITDYIRERYNNKDISIKDLAYFIDWDNDGIAGNEFLDYNERILQFEMDTLYVPKEGGSYKVKIESNLLYKFPQIIDVVNPGSGYYMEIGINNINFEKSLSDDGFLILDIKPANGILMLGQDVKVCSYDEKTITTLHIVQETDLDKYEEDEELKELFTNVLIRLKESLDINYMMEASYTNTFQLTDEWNDFMNHTLNSYNSIIYQSFSNNYNSIANFRGIKSSVKNTYPQAEVVDLAFNCFEVLSYYHLAVFWGNVQYIPIDADIWNDSFPQLKMKDLFDIFEKELKKAIELFPAKNNNNLIYVCKDIPRSILSKMYLQTGNYQNALFLLKDIINSGQYEISSSWQTAFNNNSKELIYGLSQTGSEKYNQYIINSDKIPVFTYTETLLSAAECELKTGNSGEAIRYLNMVKQKRGKLTVSSIDMEVLKNTWKEELKGTGSYFAFLKRNNLAESELGIESYQTLFPFPIREINVNPNLVQNPGYW